MNEKIVFARTSSGEDEVRSKTALLSKDIKRALLMVDGTATVAEIMKRSSPSLRGMLDDMFAELVRGGFIQDKARVVRSSKLVKPLSASPKKSVNEVEELDFTAAFRVPTQAALSEEAARLQAALEAKSDEGLKRNAAKERDRLESEVSKLKAQAEAEVRAEEHARQQTEVALRLKAEQAAASAARLAEQHAEKVRAEAQARARAVAQEKDKLEAEVAKLKAQAEVEARARAEERARQQADEAERREAARLDAERHAEEVRTEAQARARVAAEEKGKLEAEVARLKAQAEVEAQTRAEADVLAKRKAEAARMKAEQEASRIREEVELARQRAADEARASLDAERSAAEAARAQAETEAARIKAEAETAEQARARIAAEEKNKLEAEVARLKAQAEVEAHARAEADGLAKREAEAARIKAEQEASRIREEVELARQRAADEARGGLDAERIAAEAARVQAETEAARIKAEAEAAEQARAQVEQLARELAAQVKAEQEAALPESAQEAEQAAHEEANESESADTMPHGDVQTSAEMLASVVRLNAKHAAIEESVFSALDESAKRSAALATGGQRVQSDDSAVTPDGTSVSERRTTTASERRTTTAAVLFFDIVGYTKQPDRRQIELKQQFSRLLTDSLAQLGSGERIVLDTGDGAAIGFLQHPTDALESAVHFRTSLLADKHDNRLRVRIGIHLGPVSLVKDVNGQINMLGDGINSAQRVMSFAGQNQIYVSRAYFDFVSSLSDEYDDLFRYRGSQQDKHGREHQVYELLNSEGPVDEKIQVQQVESPDNLADFNFEAFDVPDLPRIEQGAPQSQPRPAAEASQPDAEEQLLMDVIGLGQMESAKAEPVSQEDSSRVVEEQADAYSEAEALQLADMQAKKWQEAEQRAAVLAREKAEIPAQKSFKPPVEAVAVAKLRRKPVPWGKLAAGLFVLIVAALFVVPAVLPMQNYVANMEQLIGSKLQQPVHIARLSGRILPAPRLVLSDVSIGETRQIQVRQAQVNFSFAALFGQVKPVASLNLDGVAVKGAALPQVSGWLQQVAASQEYPVARIILTQGQLDADGVELPDVGGELDFDPAGKFTEARLNAIGHKLALDIRAAEAQKMAVSITLRDSALPSLPNWVFDELNATGELTRDELRIADFDGRIRGGVLTGDARINWRAGWRVQGALVAKAIPLQNISKLLTGDMDGSAHFQMQAEKLSKLADAAVLTGVFSVKKGVIGGFDIIETTRLHSRESPPGGRTHFDELSGELFYANDSYRFSQLNISDSAFQAVGALTIVGQALSGHLSADLKMRAGMGSTALQVSGTTESPSLHVAR
jgi:hypothetical protein